MTCWRATATALLGILGLAAACSEVTPPTVDNEATESAPTSGPNPSVSATTEAAPAAPNARLSGRYTTEILATLPHDRSSYTQGLEFHDGYLLESTGQLGESLRRWVDPTTGEVATEVPLDDTHFGEGITVIGDRAIQLTWLSGVALVLDRNSLAEVGRFEFSGDGWGLCYDGSRLIMSDGTDQLTFRDPATFEPQGQVTVTASGDPVTHLNELECVDDRVVANVRGLDELVVINPTSGEVEAVVDAKNLRPPEAPADDSDYDLNGVAYDSANDVWYLTGKWWPTLYQVRLVASG